MFDELRSRFTLSEYIGRKNRVVKKGNRWMTCCPFHIEKTPSFHIDNAKGLYHCFGCGRSGDVIHYVMESEKLPFKEAIRVLAEEAGIELPNEQATAAKEAEFEPVKKACHEAALWFQSQLQETHKTYLAKRGITVASQALFQIGFAPGGGGLLKHLQSKDITIRDAQQAGLFMELDGRLVERFRQRLMFPITNRKGEVIAFGGRLLTNGEPKYLNSPETVLFKKNQVLYGLPQAKATKDLPYVVVEGYFDVIAMHQAGITSAVAPLGTALTENHLQFMWQRCEQPVMCFDGDTAGERAAERAAEMCLPFISPTRRLNFVHLPEGHDPASFLMDQDPQAMRTYMKQAQPLHDKLWQKLHIHELSKTSTPEEKGRFQDAMKEMCQQITHEELRRLYMNDFKQRFYLYFRQLQQPGTKRLIPSLKPKPVNKQDDMPEKLLIAMLILEPTLLIDVREHVLSIPFTSYTEWLDSIVEWAEASTDQELDDWLIEHGWHVESLLSETKEHLPRDKKFWRDFWLDVWHNTLYKRQVRQERLVSLDAFKTAPSVSRWNKLVAMKQNEERSRS